MTGFSPLGSDALGTSGVSSLLVLKAKIEEKSQITSSSSVLRKAKPTNIDNASDVTVIPKVFRVVRGKSTLEQTSSVVADGRVIRLRIAAPNIDSVSRIESNGSGEFTGQAEIASISDIVTINEMDSVGKAAIESVSSITSRSVVTPIISGKANDVVGTSGASASGRVVRIKEAAPVISATSQVVVVFFQVIFYIISFPTNPAVAKSTITTASKVARGGKTELNGVSDILSSGKKDIEEAFEIGGISNITSKLVNVKESRAELNSQSSVILSGNVIWRIARATINGSVAINTKATYRVTAKGKVEASGAVISSSKVNRKSLELLVDLNTDASSRMVRMIDGGAEFGGKSNLIAAGQRVRLGKPAINGVVTNTVNGTCIYAGDSVLPSVSGASSFGKTRSVSGVVVSEVNCLIYSRMVRMVDGKGISKPTTDSTVKYQRVRLFRPIINAKIVVSTSANYTARGYCSIDSVTDMYCRFAGKLNSKADANAESEIISRAVRVKDASAQLICKSVITSKGQRVPLGEANLGGNVVITIPGSYIAAGKTDITNVSDIYARLAGHVNAIVEANLTSEILSRAVFVRDGAGTSEPVSNAVCDSQRVRLAKNNLVNGVIEITLPGNYIARGNPTIEGVSVVSADSSNILKPKATSVLTSEINVRMVRMISGKSLYVTSSVVTGRAQRVRLFKSLSEILSEVSIPGNYVARGLAELTNLSEIVSLSSVERNAKSHSDIISSIGCKGVRIAIARPEIDAVSEVNIKYQRVRVFRPEIDSISSITSRAVMVIDGKSSLETLSSVLAKGYVQFSASATIDALSEINSASRATYRGYGTQNNISDFYVRFQRILAFSAVIEAVSRITADGDTLVVEDNTGLPNAESYVTVKDAVKYFERYGGGSAFLAADNSKKRQALRSATLIVDRMIRWNGEPLNPNQALQFPRIG